MARLLYYIYGFVLNCYDTEYLVDHSQIVSVASFWHEIGIWTSDGNSGQFVALFMKHHFVAKPLSTLNTTQIIGDVPPTLHLAAFWLLG